MKTTQKEVKAKYHTIIKVPYCELQTLLTYKSRVAHTEWREGWAADIYDMGGGVAIVTGYAPFGNVKPTFEVIRRYKHAAEAIRYDYSIKWEEHRERLNHLIHEFIEEVTSDAHI